MEQELKAVVTLLAQNRWPFRLHATYDESIARTLNIYEEVDRGLPPNGLHWFIDHAETISERNMERIQALGGGIAIQRRMAFQGEYFPERYGELRLSRRRRSRKCCEWGCRWEAAPTRPVWPVTTHSFRSIG
jgi:hypothetical protein